MSSLTILERAGISFRRLGYTWSLKKVEDILFASGVIPRGIGMLLGIWTGRSTSALRAGISRCLFGVLLSLGACFLAYRLGDIASTQGLVPDI